MFRIKKIVAYFFLFSSVFCSCKMKTNDILKEVPKKQNRLERTQWKSTTNSESDSDVLLDFYTHQDVQEYVTLPNGKEIKAREGTYRLSKTGHLKLKFGKLKSDQLDGYIRGKELVIQESFKTRTYHKVKDY